MEKIVIVIMGIPNQRAVVNGSPCFNSFKNEIDNDIIIVIIRSNIISPNVPFVKLSANENAIIIKNASSMNSGKFLPEYTYTGVDSPKKMNNVIKLREIADDTVSAVSFILRFLLEK